MKKIVAIIIIVMIILTPAVVSSQDNLSLMEEYSSNDSILTNNTEKYNDLLENRDDRLDMYEKMRISKKNSFYTAQSLASRENGIAQVDFDIENTYNSIQSREALLEVNFRKSYLNLYEQKISYEEAWISYTKIKSEYTAAKSSHTAGYISANTLLSFKYNSNSAYNTYLMKKRKYESTLRSFNFDMGYPLDYNDFDYVFNEEIVEIQDPNIYFNSVLKNSSAIINYEQILSRYYVEKKNFDIYSLSTNISYIRETLELLEINTQLAKLEQEKLRSSIKEKIDITYNNLLIEFMTLALEDYNLEILFFDYQINKNLYNKGYIDKEELTESLGIYSSAHRDYRLSVFEYNTNLKSLEYDCAFYTEESDGE